MGSIYRIKSNMSDRVYIGSTKKDLNKRLKEHQSACFNWLGGHGVYLSSFEVAVYPDATIELLEQVVGTTQDLKRREGEHISQTVECVNIRIAGRTTKQFMQTDYYKNYHKEYYRHDKQKQKRLLKYRQKKFMQVGLEQN